MNKSILHCSQIIRFISSESDIVYYIFSLTDKSIREMESETIANYTNLKQLTIVII